MSACVTVYSTVYVLSSPGANESIVSTTWSFAVSTNVPLYFTSNESVTSILYRVTFPLFFTYIWYVITSFGLTFVFSVISCGSPPTGVTDVVVFSTNKLGAASSGVIVALSSSDGTFPSSSVTDTVFTSTV